MLDEVAVAQPEGAVPGCETARSVGQEDRATVDNEEWCHGNCRCRNLNSRIRHFLPPRRLELPSSYTDFHAACHRLDNRLSDDVVFPPRTIAAVSEDLAGRLLNCVA